MKDRFVDIDTPSGRMETFVTHPEHDGPFPAVIIYMDIWGVRDELFEIARRVGTVGYYCLVPDFYYRGGTVRHEFRDEQNRMISLDALDEERRAKHLASFPSIPETMAARALIVYHLAAQRPMMGAFLDALGIKHEKGLIEEDAVKPDADKVGPAAAKLAEQFPAEDVRIYLNTLLSQDPETWGGLAGLPQL
jgi:hypothetical protein